MYCFNVRIVNFLLFGALVMSLKLENIWKCVGGYSGIEIGG